MSKKTEKILVVTDSKAGVTCAAECVFGEDTDNLLVVENYSDMYNRVIQQVAPLVNEPDVFIDELDNRESRRRLKYRKSKHNRRRRL